MHQALHGREHGWDRASWQREFCGNLYPRRPCRRGRRRLGGVALPPLRATRRPLGGLLAPAGHRVGMILGSDALRGRALTLDFTVGRIEHAESPASARGVGVPLLLDHGVPAIEAEIAGCRLWLRIDTGASLFDTDDVFVNLPAAVWDDVRGRTSTLRTLMT